MSPRASHPILAFLAVGFLSTTGLHAQQQQDASPVDVNQLLKELKGMATKQDVQTKAAKMAAFQQVSSAAAAGDGGVTFWAEAIRATQMEGAGQESNNFRIWKETDGEVFKDKAVQSAVHLHLEWLALTLERSAGATVKEMLPALTSYTQELWADIAYMSMLDEAIKKDKESQPPQAAGGRRGGAVSPITKAIRDDTAVRKMHDQILNRSLGGSIIVEWMRIGDYVGAEGWEANPGNIDGIYKNIIQPELRIEKDQRVFEYWDTKMKVDADAATRSKLTFEVEKYNSDTRPALMWGRAQEYVALGQKNRAATEMYNIIKSFPGHPASGAWIGTLQALLAPPPPETTSQATPAPGVTVTPPAPTAPAPAAPPPNPTAALPGALPGQ